MSAVGALIVARHTFNFVALNPTRCQTAFLLHGQELLHAVIGPRRRGVLGSGPPDYSVYVVLALERVAIFSECDTLEVIRFSLMPHTGIGTMGCLVYVVGDSFGKLSCSAPVNTSTDSVPANDSTASAAAQFGG
ncbi:hypothetical protein BDZ89DRAFT_1049299 [Hymenopellis radicata]|nr:hypothetical protein BDZ89DRAFT_1049299 [Hymenopellis radicata]